MYTEIIIRLDGIRPKLAEAICQSVKSMSPSVDIIDVILHTKPADGNDDQTEDEDDQTERKPDIGSCGYYSSDGNYLELYSEKDDECLSVNIDNFFDEFFKMTDGKRATIKGFIDEWWCSQEDNIYYCDNAEAMKEALDILLHQQLEKHPDGKRKKGIVTHP